MLIKKRKCPECGGEDESPTKLSPIILIRADASVKIGIGHVMRCLTLADELCECNMAKGASHAFKTALWARKSTLSKDMK